VTDINSTIESSGEEEDPATKYMGKPETVTRWLKEINVVKESKARRTFEKVGEKVVKTYRNAASLDAYSRSTSTARHVMFNVLWSNVQILKPALYARMPKVVVERRFKDQDPVGRLAASIAERCTSYSLDEQKDKFNWVIKSCVEDRLLPGVGQAFVRYEAKFGPGQKEDGSPLVDPKTNEPVIMPIPTTEKSLVEYVFWQDYVTNASRGPYDLRWQARKAYMTRSELKKNFGDDIGSAVELVNDKKKDKCNDTEGEFLRQAEVWEIEDKENQIRLWISPGYKAGPLKVKEDNLRLRDFFSYPRPLLATTTTDSMVPTADYVIYERLAEELDYVTKRISSMVDCIKLVGITAGSLYEKLKNVLKLNDGDLWPIENWGAIADKGGLKAAIEWLPFDMAVAALQPLMAQQQSLMAQIDLITGIPDLLRGSTDPNETAKAIQKKSQWMVLKMEERQEDVQRFCRDLIGKMAEIIFEPGLFSDQTIRLMCGFDQMPEDDKVNYEAALQLLRDDRLQTFRVDIETDSTIAADETEDIAQWQEYMASIAGLVAQVQNVSQFAPELLHPMIESAKSAVRMLRTGKNVEGAWDSAWKPVEDRMQNPEPPPPPPPDPMVDVKHRELDIKERSQGFDEYMRQEELNYKAQVEQLDFEIRSQEVQIKGLSAESKAQYDAMTAELEKFKEQFRQYVDSQMLELNAAEVALQSKELDTQVEALHADQVMSAVSLAHEKQQLEHSMELDAHNAAMGVAQHHADVVDSHRTHGVEVMRAKADQIKAKNLRQSSAKKLDPSK